MKKFIYLAVIIIIAISVIYNFRESNDPETYKAQILEARAEQDRFMRYSEDSPFAEEEDSVDSLQYFPPDPTFKIIAEFSPPENLEIVTLTTNDNKSEEFLPYGTATFTLDGQSHTLQILENVAEEKLFIPFGDATSANETYGAGRYLDIEHHGSRTVVLDFNTAYNPYCAYVDRYTCPLPPIENLLSVEIRAGEKNYH